MSLKQNPHLMLLLRSGQPSLHNSDFLYMKNCLLAFLPSASSFNLNDQLPTSCLITPSWFKINSQHLFIFGLITLSTCIDDSIYVIHPLKHLDKFDVDILRNLRSRYMNINGQCIDGIYTFKISLCECSDCLRWTPCGARRKVWGSILGWCTLTHS